MSARRLLLALAAMFCMAAASDPAERLPDPSQEARARHIFEQVRCLVCQNESIDDSEAELAHDLRRVVREQVREGRSDSQIKHYLTDRYGEFVLLRPSISWGNAALWGAPFAVAAIGVILLMARWRARAPEPELTATDFERLKRIEDESL